MQNSKILFLLLCAFFGYTSLSAQIAVGVRAGVGFNEWEVDAPTNSTQGATFSNDFENYSNYVFAVPVEISLTESFAVQPELTFVKKGSTATEDFGELGGVSLGELEAKYELTYISIPVLAKLKFGSETAGLAVLAGPSFAYATKGEGTFTSRNSSEPSQNGVSVIDLFEDEQVFSRSDVNVHAGISPYVSVGNLNLFVDARYLFGLSDLEEEDDDTTISNRSIQLSAGILFDLF